MRRVPRTTRRLLVVGALLAAGLALLVAGTAASGDDDGYRVRAIFDSGSFLVPGEDVKVAGVVVGAIESLDVTPDHKAVIVLRIDDPAFQDFRADATCAIRLQSLIGEKYIQCDPTQPKAEGAEQAPPLRRIGGGEGEGQYLLPVERTSSPVDIDLITNMNRVPERQRLGIILNELGVGLAGNGEELRRVIRRANPALQRLDDVLQILAEQDHVLADLARDSDAALGPLAREADRIPAFIRSATTTATATAERGDALEASLAKFPAFLRQLQPTMERLDELALAGEPVFANLRAAAPSVNQLVSQLGPFSKAALPTVRTIGDAAERSNRALQIAEPLIDDLRAFGKASGPFSQQLSTLLTSLRSEHGIERLADTILNFTGALNGFDAVGHYARVMAVVYAQCIEYRTTPLAVCGANFGDGGGSAATASAVRAAGRPALEVPLFDDENWVGSAADALVPTTAQVAQPQPATAPAEQAGAEPAASQEPAATPQPSTQAPTPEQSAREGLLGYLLGGGEGR